MVRLAIWAHIPYSNVINGTVSFGSVSRMVVVLTFKGALTFVLGGKAE